jgi:hypothetical protein
MEGHAAPFGDPESISTFNKEQEHQQRLKGDKLVGLKNVMESEKIRTFKVKIKRNPRK